MFLAGETLKNSSIHLTATAPTATRPIQVRTNPFVALLPLPVPTPPAQGSLLLAITSAFYMGVFCEHEICKYLGVCRLLF